MNFTILSHAGLCVEHHGVRIVSDPWLIGSCYWRSWWNFPEPPPSLIENLNPDYIYLTHLHWDHFHGASLKKLFSPNVRILVPEVPTERMVLDLNYLGFHNVTEIPHGGMIRLGEDFTLHSYQLGPGVDSAMLLQGGGVTLFNCNDCKHFGLPLRQITDKFPKIDFVFRSHSNASAVPYCIKGYETMLPNLRSPQDYIEEFSRFALFVGARYAIPFASNHCFLHKETFQYNQKAVLAEHIPSYYKQLAEEYDRKSECVVMVPGSAWSQSDGFKIVPFDYEKKDEYIQSLLARHEAKLLEQYEKEAKTIADFGVFKTYFEGFLKAIPFWMRKWAYGASEMNCSIIFRTHDRRGEQNWQLNMETCTVSALPEAPEEDRYIILETPALVLNDCARVRMFSTWTPSKRLSIHLPSPHHLKQLRLLFQLLDLYEVDILPLRKNFSIRSLRNHCLRWREAIELLRLIFKHKILGHPFIPANLYPL
jgi:UDP-MurNAc hydroxylase